MTNETKLRWFPILQWLAGGLIVTTVFVVTIQAQINGKVDERAFSDTLSLRREKEAAQWVRDSVFRSEIKMGIDSLLRYNKALVRRVCGKLPPGEDC